MACASCIFPPRADQRIGHRCPADEVASREFVDFHARDRRVETPVEVIEALQCGEFGGGGAARDLALLPHVDLVVQDQLQEFGMMEPAGGGFLVPAESVLCERGHGLVGAQIQVDALRGESALKPAVITARRGSSRLAGPGEKPAVGLVAGFCGGAYRFTVSRSTSRSRDPSPRPAPLHQGYDCLLLSHLESVRRARCSPCRSRRESSLKGGWS